MGFENPNYIEDLNPLWPLFTDYKKEGAAHIRGIKKALQGSFPTHDFSNIGDLEIGQSIIAAALGADFFLINNTWRDNDTGGANYQPSASFELSGLSGESSWAPFDFDFPLWWLDSFDSTFMLCMAEVSLTLNNVANEWVEYVEFGLGFNGALPDEAFHRVYVPFVDDAVLTGHKKTIRTSILIDPRSKYFQDRETGLLQLYVRKAATGKPIEVFNASVFTREAFV